MKSNDDSFRRDLTTIKIYAEDFKIVGAFQAFIDIDLKARGHFCVSEGLVGFLVAKKL